MKRVTGEYLKSSPRIGIHEWSLETIEEGAKDLLNAAMKEAMEIATSEYECNAWFSAEYGASPSDAPTTIYVELPIGPSDDESPCWKFDLTELVDNLLEGHEMGYGGPLSDEGVQAATAVRDGLRALVEKIDARLTVEVK